MSGSWKEVARLSFQGERFRDHALDQDALTEVIQFQRIMAETAKALWLAVNPDRRHLPAHFEKGARLCLRKIENGSTIVPLEVYVEKEALGVLWEEQPPELTMAVNTAHDLLMALEADSPLPEDMSRELLDEYAKWGQTLGDDEVIELHISDKEPARMTSAQKHKLRGYLEKPHEAFVDFSGEVFEADVKQARFQILAGKDTRITVAFTLEQEEQVTTALKEHKRLRLHVRGLGEYSAQGKLLRVTKVVEMNFVTEERQYDRTTRPIEEVLEELAKEVPQEEWDKLPDDLTDNLDHYLYGTPKR